MKDIDEFYEYFWSNNEFTDCPELNEKLFAEAYAKQKIEEIRNELYEIMPTGKINVSDMIDATVKAFRAIDEHLKQPQQKV